MCLGKKRAQAWPGLPLQPLLFGVIEDPQGCPKAGPQALGTRLAPRSTATRRN